MSFWSNVFRKRAEDWANGWLDPAQIPGSGPRTAIQAEKMYLHVFLKSMRIVDVRKLTTTFYGTVHSYISIPHRSGQRAEFNVVVTPNELRKVDPKHVDRTLSMNHRLLGPVPFRGGDIEFEIGLFSVKEADLAQPFLTVLEKMSSIAGVAFIQTALPFASPIKEGIDLLMGTADDSILECGVAMTLPHPPLSGYFVVLRAPKGAVSVPKLKVDPNDFKLLNSDGSQVSEYPYMVLEVSVSQEREAWFDIAEIATTYRDLNGAVRGGNPSKISEALAVFSRIVKTNDDMLEDQAKKVCADVANWVNDTGAVPLTAAGSRHLPLLRSIRF